MVNKDLQRIINQIVDRRVNLNISQKSFADSLRLKKSNLNRIEKGKENVSFDLIIRMVKELGYEMNLRLEVGNPNDEIYLLKQYDHPLLAFKLNKTKLDDFICEIVSINKDNLDLLPLDLETTNESLLSFLKKRTIPKNRTYVEEILSANGLKSDDLKGILDLCMGLSLNDSYWITKYSFKGKFKDYNLYENDFSTALSTVAFTGNSSSKIILTTSPEFTTLGMLPKAWRKIDNKVYLFKGSTSGFVNSGNEAYVEYLCSQILDKMGIDHVPYSLTKWKNNICSVCPIFTDIDTSYIHIGRIVKTGGLEAVISYYEKLGSKYISALYSMLVFDALIYNEDRHFGNFGLLVNNKTNKICGPAPIFDNGNGLFHYALEKDYKDLKSYANSRDTHNPYNKSFNIIAKVALQEEQIAQLKRLKNFKFKNDINYPYPKYKLTAIEEFIQFRVNELLELVK